VSLPRVPLRCFAVVLVALGLAVTGLTTWKILDPLAGPRQAAAQRELERSWATAPPARTAAQPECVPRLSSSMPVRTYFAIIQIPALGKDWKFTVIEGTDLPQLSTGPGHVPGTALPGAEGNVGIAAHDVTAGNPFLHLADLKPGDRIIITTNDCVTTYVVDRPSYRVLYTDVAILKPDGRKHTVTLITCWPVNVLYFVPHRTIVSAEEVSSVPRLA
jgi:sortase A